MGLRGPQSTVDVDKALDYRCQGLSMSETAKLMNTSKANMVRIVGGIEVPDKEELVEFKDNRADIFAGLQSRILKTLTDDEIKRIPPGSRMTALGIAYDKERLERGQATSHVLHAHLAPGAVKSLEEIARAVADKESDVR